MDKLHDRRPSHGGNRTWAACLSRTASHEILDFSASINPLGPPEAVVRCIQAHIEALNAYPDPDYQDLRLAIAKQHNISPDWVLPGNGSAELLTWACRELSTLDWVYTVQPGFGDYQRALSAFSAPVYPCFLLPWVSPEPTTTGFDLTHWQPISDLDRAVPQLSPESLMASEQSRGLLLNNPHNPTGLQFTQDSITQLLDQFELVVVDEAFMDFLPSDQQNSLIEQVAHYPQLVILRSLTKFYSLPGLRLGYAIAHPERLQRWQAWRDPWPVNTLAAVAGIAALDDQAFQAQTTAWMNTAQPLLHQGLAQIAGLVVLPSQVNFFLVRSPVAVPDLQLRLLQTHQILIRDCLSFAELGDRYFRVAVRTEVDNAKLLSALRSQLED